MQRSTAWSCLPVVSYAQPAPASAHVKRWDGNSLTSTEWDGLRKVSFFFFFSFFLFPYSFLLSDCLHQDAELWTPDGNCFVHLYERGHSRRGPSFCIPISALRDAHAGTLFSLCFARSVSRAELPIAQLSSLVDPPDVLYELYMPAPDGCLREEALQFHITTRNFFAFVLKKPLVGAHLGTSLIHLQERLHLFCSRGPTDNHNAFLRYAEELGYLDFTHRPSNALAILFYAEHYQLEELWLDAYAHCVGMNETLYMSPEYDPIPRVTKALITRAWLEMDLHLGRVTRALGNLLEDELSPSYLGLPHGARTHLDRFRAFLRSYYVEKYGFWPPPKSVNFPKALYRSMYADFRSLYDLLVDLDSSDSIQYQKPADGGICVLQNVQAFDRRHKYAPLPHPLPLVPSSPQSHGHHHSHRNLTSLAFSYKRSDKQSVVQSSLSAAMNPRDSSVAPSPLVKAYKRFERDCLTVKEKVSVSDARKVRWILIYAVLQMLISVTRAPPEVHDTEDADYPLCCLTAGTPPWAARNKSMDYSYSKAGDFGTISDNGIDSPASTLNKPLPETPGSIFDIRPDCEVNDYITHTNPSCQNTSLTSSLNRRFSLHAAALQLSEVPPPLRISRSQTTNTQSDKRRGTASPAQLERSTSWRSALPKSLSPFSSRRNSLVGRAGQRRLSFCEIQVPGYGNGLNEATLAGTAAAAPPEIPERAASSASSSSSAVRAAGTHGVNASSESSVAAAAAGAAVRRALPGKLVLNTNTTCLPISEEEKERRTPTLDSFQLDQGFPLALPKLMSTMTAARATARAATPSASLSLASEQQHLLLQHRFAAAAAASSASPAPFRASPSAALAASTARHSTDSASTTFWTPALSPASALPSPASSSATSMSSSEAEAEAEADEDANAAGDAGPCLVAAEEEEEEVETPPARRPPMVSASSSVASAASAAKLARMGYALPFRAYAAPEPVLLSTARGGRDVQQSLAAQVVGAAAAVGVGVGVGEDDDDDEFEDADEVGDGDGDGEEEDGSELLWYEAAREVGEAHELDAADTAVAAASSLSLSVSVSASGGDSRFASSHSFIITDDNDDDDNDDDDSAEANDVDVGVDAFAAAAPRPPTSTSTSTEAQAQTHELPASTTSPPPTNTSITSLPRPPTPPPRRHRPLGPPGAKARHLLGLDDSEKEVDGRQVVSIYQALFMGPCAV
ncbi:uncharacterized protein K452DRAFT_358496 [Aplosporella prunicola CBS 121167]|uniref:DUF8004 domain-containing protein n=1 Tax=Aplosporella prunicola CBS 121167 TaxID=1176127 RepID=A0A6A6BEQ0_9PEZI|nr:uncharacterized protein K452DRAFT_358496 [Aplosporella prunicola CBS 121167]KAF2142018.1 hypothetical protein K452DRAFT_358496 [Aplosporella prunicola CBS 121167]